MNYRNRLIACQATIILPFFEKNDIIDHQMDNNMVRNQKHSFCLDLLVLVGIFTFVSILAASKGPVLKFEKEMWDFGRVKQGKILTHVFKFRNNGDATLAVKRVRTSCGCTAALVSNKKILPGQQGEIKVTFNTRGYGGRVSKFIYIESNDSQESKKQLTVSATINVPPRPKISLDRYSIDLGLFLQSEDIETEAKIKNTGELELEVEFSHKSASFYIGNKKVPTPLKVPAGKDVEVRIKIIPRQKVGLMREYVLLKTNDPMRPNLSFYISGYIVTKIQLQQLFKKYKDAIK